MNLKPSRRLRSVLLAGLVLEAGSALALRLARPRLSHGSEPSNERGVPNGREFDDIESNLVLHPYLGYVFRTGQDDYGFRTVSNPIQTRSPDKAIIAFLGGSVAFHFCGHPESFIQALRRDPLFTRKRIVILNLAVDGFKQPQQLMALGYMLALGGQFDAVINIDGYNEVAAAKFDDPSAKVFPFYPRIWWWLAQRSPSIQSLKILAEIERLKARRGSLARLRSAFPLRCSGSANLGHFDTDT